MTSATKFIISTATQADMAAIRDLIPVEQAAVLSDAPTASQSGLSDGVTCLVAKQDQQLRGIVLARWLAPAIGSITGPFLSNPDDASTSALLTEITSRFDQSQTRLISTLRATDDPSPAALQQAGFQAVARIAFMVATSLRPERPTMSSSITAQLVSPNLGGQRRRWQGVLAGTFEQTLDCPMLRRAMSPEDTIATFERSSFDEQQWLIATDDGQDVGCLILGFDDDEEAVEILYVGVVNSFRLRGYGKQLLQVAFAAARQRNCRRVGLGVDASNRPAVSLYNESGFYEYDQRDLLVRVLRS